jgi:hypothetical protein
VRVVPFQNCLPQPRVQVAVFGQTQKVHLSGRERAGAALLKKLKPS